ncbi:hypothetical protein GGD63_001440 [Bradyrhizobium sp. cir1]|uniref:hypothetical protein n=1 Tax=Bradyrhizobium sp. cir1 TaxID=1445730 RepID=UPI0016058FB7|nr:hypothetical protein [Bradyrhizobium sp. cir1]MBB4368661.1 hypothetical protein [Bradyrhizobium sp. cir1]
MTANLILVLTALALIPYAVPALMPTWRWWLATTCIFGGMLAALWTEHWIVSSRLNYNEGPGGGIGVAFWALVTSSFATGVVVRGCTLLFAACGLRLRYVLAIGILGFAIVPALIVVESWWHDWKRRPASEACRSTTFHVTIANAALSIPAASFWNIYLGRTSGQDAYYLEQGVSLREFCGVNDDGKRPVKATKIWLRLRSFGLVTPPLCTGPVADWARTYCDAHETARRGGDDKLDFPLNIYVFAPDEVIPGEFGGARSTYQDSLKATPQSGDVYVTSDASSGTEPLTFRCHQISTDYWCGAFYPWRDGAHLGYTFQSPREEIAARGGRIDAETRKLLSGFEPH